MLKNKVTAQLMAEGKNGACQGYVFAGTFGLLLRQASLGVNFCAPPCGGGQAAKISVRPAQTQPCHPFLPPKTERLKNKLFFFGVIYAIIFTLSGPVYPENADTQGPVVKTRAAQPFKYDAKGRRDPFIPLVNREGLLLEPAVKKENPQAETALYLEGIVYEPQGGSCAVINSEIVKAGDTIGDYQVLEVQRQKVVLGKAEEVLTLELRKEDE